MINHGYALPELSDSIFVHDPVLTTNGGVIQLRMGKPLRRGEEEVRYSLHYYCRTRTDKLAFRLLQSL